MSWSSGGRYWNVGLSDPGRLAATERQLWYLHLLSGRKTDYRGRGLTRDEASALIESLKRQQLESRRDLVMRDAYYSALYAGATEAADRAGEQWMKENS